MSKSFCIKYSPYEILAVRTECRLFEESGNETMILDVVDVLLFQCTFSISVTNIDFILLLLTHIIVSHFDSLVWFSFFLVRFFFLFIYLIAKRSSSFLLRQASDKIYCVHKSKRFVLQKKLKRHKSLDVSFLFLLLSLPQLSISTVTVSLNSQNFCCRSTMIRLLIRFDWFNIVLAFGWRIPRSVFT